MNFRAFMLFHDRGDAARRLLETLQGYRSANDTVIVALPRGGVVVGRVLADALKLPLDIIVARKIGAPGNPEYAIGAVSEEGEPVWNEVERQRIDRRYLVDAVARERAEARRRLGRYREGLPPRDFRGKTVVIVDDGIATGLTIRAAIAMARALGVSRIVVAAPVAPPDTVEELKREADEVIVLETPLFFTAVGAFYRAFPQVDDATVLALLRRESSVRSTPQSPSV